MYLIFSKVWSTRMQSQKLKYIYWCSIHDSSDDLVSQFPQESRSNLDRNIWKKQTRLRPE